MSEVENNVAQPAKAATKDSEQTPPTDDPNVNIPVEPYLPDNVPTFYSDGMVVVHSANEFVVSFLLTDFPLAVGKEELEKVTVLRRKCVARIIMSPAQFDATTQALQQNLRKYQDSHNINE